jgi:hypothetical protein
MNCQTPFALAREMASAGRRSRPAARGEVGRQALRAEDVLNHRQVLAAAPHAFFQEIVEPALKELDKRQHALIERDRELLALHQGQWQRVESRRRQQSNRRRRKWSGGLLSDRGDGAGRRIEALPVQGRNSPCEQKNQRRDSPA